MKINNDVQISSSPNKIDAITEELFLGNSYTKPPKGFYSVEELTNHFKFSKRKIVYRLAQFKKENKLEIIDVIARDNKNRIKHVPYYKVSK